MKNKLITNIIPSFKSEIIRFIVPKRYIPSDIDKTVFNILLLGIIFRSCNTKFIKVGIGNRSNNKKFIDEKSITIPIINPKTIPVHLAQNLIPNIL